MDRLRAMQIFTAVAEAGSLSAASREMGVPLTTLAACKHGRLVLSGLFMAEARAPECFCGFSDYARHEEIGVSRRGVQMR